MPLRTAYFIGATYKILIIIIVPSPENFKKMIKRGKFMKIKQEIF